MSHNIHFPNTYLLSYMKGFYAVAANQRLVQVGYIRRPFWSSNRDWLGFRNGITTQHCIFSTFLILRIACSRNESKFLLYYKRKIAKTLILLKSEMLALYLKHFLNSISWKFNLVSIFSKSWLIDYPVTEFIFSKDYMKIKVSKWKWYLAKT